MERQTSGLHCGVADEPSTLGELRCTWAVDEPSDNRRQTTGSLRAVVVALGEPSCIREIEKLGGGKS